MGECSAFAAALDASSVKDKQRRGKKRQREGQLVKEKVVPVHNESRVSALSSKSAGDGTSQAVARDISQVSLLHAQIIIVTLRSGNSRLFILRQFRLKCA